MKEQGDQPTGQLFTHDNLPKGVKVRFAGDIPDLIRVQDFNGMLQVSEFDGGGQIIIGQDQQVSVSNLSGVIVTRGDEVLADISDIKQSGGASQTVYASTGSTIKGVRQIR